MHDHGGEKRKKLALYLHPHEIADRLALDEIETVPRKLRGELYRQALITGLIMHQLDNRIPAILTALFIRKLHTDEVINQISQITGWKPSVADLKDVLAALGYEYSKNSPAITEDNEEQRRLKTVRAKMKNLM